MKSSIVTAVCVGAGALLVGSCATLSQEQCLAGNWHAIGVADGEQGYASSRLSEHTEACARHGVTPDSSAYFAGREQGLSRYCTPGNGFRIGSSGGGYGGVCPPGLENDFMAAFSDGQIVWNAQSRLNGLRNDRTNAQNRADQLERDIRAEEDRLAQTGLSEDERRRLRDRIRDLRRDREDALDQARRAEWAARDAEREVADLRARLAPRYGW